MSSSVTPHPRSYRIVWRTSIAIGFALILLLLLVQRSPAHSNRIDLINFSASSLAGQPEVYISWGTAREWDVVGFFISRSLTATTAYTRTSDFVPHEGDGLTGAQYYWLDETTELSRTYYYRLEIINTDMTIDYYGPISITAGIHPYSILVFPRVYLPRIRHAN